MQCFIDNSPGDAIRDPRTFKQFAKIAGITDEELDRWLQALDVQAVSALEWLWRPNWSIGPRIVQDCMWFCILRGRGDGWIHSPQQKFRFKAGDIILIPQGEEHYIAQDAGVDSHVIAVHFFARIFDAFSLLQLIQMPMTLRTDEHLPFVKASERVAREFAVKAPAWRSMMSAEIRSLLIGILRLHGAQCEAQSHSLACLLRFQPVFQLIERDIANPSLTIQEMARAVFLSEVQFRKLFRTTTGLPPVAFLQRRRIERACELLLSTEASIESIAEQCGFTQSSFFYRTFRRWMSTTPQVYRSCRNV
jgi:AraC-like DNA-binding protein